MANGSSGFRLDLRLHTKEVDRFYKKVIKEVKPQATLRTLNRTANSVKGQASSMIGKKAGVQKGKVTPYITVKGANKLTYTAYVRPRVHVFNLIEFVPKSKQNPTAFRKTNAKGVYKYGGVEHKAWGHKRVTKGTFIGKGKNSGKMLVYKRRDNNQKNRYPIKAVPGPAIHTIFGYNSVMQALERHAARYAEKEYIRNVKYYLSKIYNI